MAASTIKFLSLARHIAVKMYEFEINLLMAP